MSEYDRECVCACVRVCAAMYVSEQYIYYAWRLK